MLEVRVEGQSGLAVAQMHIEPDFNRNVCVCVYICVCVCMHIYIYIHDMCCLEKALASCGVYRKYGQAPRGGLERQVQQILDELK